MGNLGPLTRTEHRAKTLGGWQARQPDLGTYLWRSPDGLVAVTTNQGTLLLGDRHWAHQVWHTAHPGRSEMRADRKPGLHVTNRSSAGGFQRAPFSRQHLIGRCAKLCW